MAQLCTYSRSEVLAQSVLEACPLDLTQGEHEQCPCRRREHLQVSGRDLRVLTCTFPKTWKGKHIVNPPAFAEALRRNWGTEAAWAIERKVQLEAEAMSKAPPALRAPLWPQPIPVIGLTGAYASGKTLFGLTIAPGPDTLVYDTEKSSESYLGLGFERIDVPAEMLRRHPRGYKPIDTFVWWRDHMRSLPLGKYRVVVLDTASEIESGLYDYVLAHPQEFGKTATQYARASALAWGDVKEHWKALLSELSSRCETFVFTVHLRQVWAGNAPTSKQAPKGKSTLEELASLYLWLERKPDAKGNVPAQPAAIVRKSRLAHTRINPETGVVEIVPALPPRLPVATPAAIRQYQLTPPDYSKLKAEELAPEEKMTDDERAELRARTAEAEAEAERLRLERLERSQRPAAPKPATVEEPRKIHVPTQPPAAEATPANGHKPTSNGTGKATEDQLARLKELRDELFRRTEEPNPADRWLAILAKRGVTTARDLNEVQCQYLIQAIRAQLVEVDREAEGNPGDGGDGEESEGGPPPF